MNSRQLQLSNATENHSSDLAYPRVTGSRVTRRIQGTAYNQRNASVTHHHHDGQQQRQQMTQHQGIQFVCENQPDGTQYTHVQHFQSEPMTAVTGGPYQQQPISGSAEQPQNALASFYQHNAQNQQSYALVDEHVDESRHVEQSILSQRVSRFSPSVPRQHIQQIQNLESIPPSRSIQPSNNAVVPTSYANTIVHQPMPSGNNVPVRTEIRERRQGREIQLETETRSRANNGEYLAKQTNAIREEHVLREITNVVNTPDGIYEHVMLVAERRVFH